MMGDNRDNSTDSRVLSQVGYVPFENIVGRAEIIFFSIGDGERAMGDVALAMGGALAPVVHHRPMSRRKATSQSPVPSPDEPTADGGRGSQRGAQPEAGILPRSAPQAPETATLAGLETRIGYRFKDMSLARACADPCLGR